MTLETIQDANGSQTEFTFTFGYLEKVDISVAVKPSGGSYADKTLDTHYTLGTSSITFTSGNVPANNSKVRIRRTTDVSNPRHTFQAGSTITAQALNENAKQLLYGLAERGHVASGESTLSLDTGTHDEIEVKSATDWEIVDGKVGTSKLADNSVTGPKVADNAIDSDHYVDLSIDTAHIANNQITTAKILDENVTTSKLAPDAVTGAKIGDDAINSEHIAAGAVDLEHMSPASVDEENLYISNTGNNGDYLQKQSGNSGGLTWAAVPANAGLMKQFIAGTTSTEVDMNTTLTDTGLTATITTTGTNKVFILIQQSYRADDGNGGFWWEHKLLRGSTQILFRQLNHDQRSAGGTSKEVASLMYLDTPGAGTHVYKTQFRGGDDDGKAQPDGERSDIFLMELAI